MTQSKKLEAEQHRYTSHGSARNTGKVKLGWLLPICLTVLFISMLIRLEATGVIAIIVMVALLALCSLLGYFLTRTAGNRSLALTLFAWLQALTQLHMVMGGIGTGLSVLSYGIQPWLLSLGFALVGAQIAHLQLVKRRRARLQELQEILEERRIA